MTSRVRIDLTIPSNEATFLAKTLPINTDGHRSFVNLSTYFAAIAGATYSGRVHETTGAVQATGTVTFSSTGPTNTQTMTLANITITAVTSGATGNQININASPTVLATELAALINSSASFSGIVSATSLAGVVTVTSNVPGTAGNGLQLSAGTFSNTVASGFTGGVDGHKYDFSVGQA